ncbi:RHO1 GDP-GTP exchange protein 2, partial [Nowakowskiella sp. JEL0078]
MEPGHYQSRHGKNLHISTSQNTLYNNEGVDQRLLDLIDVEMLPDDFDTDLEHVTDSTDIKRSWRELVDKEYLSTVPEIEQDRQEFIVSLVYTQREFIDDLDFLAKFLESLLDSPVMRPSLHALLLKTKKLYIPNNEFLVSLDQRQNADFPLVGGIADICDTAIKSFGNPNLFLEYSRTLKGALEDFKTELKRNDFLSKYIESWTQWSEAEYGQTKRVEMVMRSPVHHLARISNLLERILSRLPATNSLQHKHVDSNLLPDVIIRVKSMQREMTRQVGVEEVLSPLIRLDSTASNADKTDLEVKKRLQESANESAKAYETVRARSRRPQDNNIVRTESKVEKIKVELKEDAEFWHTSVPEEVIPLLDIGEKEVKRQGTIFELVRSYAKYVDQLDFLAKIVENLNVAIDNGTVIVKGEMITSSSKIAPTVMSPSSINNKSLPANTKLSDRFSSSGKAAIRRIFEQQKYVKRVFVEPTSVMSFQAIILSELRERQKAEHPLVTGVGDVLLRNFLELEPILAYAQRHVRVEKEFERQIATNESFEKFIEESRRSHPERKDIKDFYLARPKQFQFGLKLLVETLIKNTRSSLEEFKNSPNKRPLFVEKLKDEISSLTQAFDVLHKFISKMDDTVAKIMDEMKVDILLEKKLVWTPRVLPQINVTTDLEQIKNITRQSANELLRGKRLIREGPMAVKDKTLEIPIYVFLFENVLLITEARNNGETYKVFAKPVSLELIAFDDETTQQRKYQPDAPLTAIESMKDPTRRLLREPTNASLFGTLSVNSSTSTLTPQQKSSSFTITHLGNRKEPLGGTYLLRFPSEFEQEGWQNAIRVAREAYVTSLIPGSLTSTGMIFNIEEVANVPRLDVDGNIDEPKIAQIENLAANRPTGLGELVGNSISAIARIGLKHLIVGSSEGVYVVPEISWKSGDEGPSKAIRLPLTGMLSDKHEGYLQKISAIELMPEENTLAILADRTLYTFKLQLILDHCHLPRISKKNKASITPQVRGDSGFSFFGRKNNETQHTTKASDFRGEVLKKDINWMRLLCDRGGPGGGTGATAFSAGDYLTGLANGVHQEDGKATEYHNFLVAFRPALSETSVYVFEPSKLGDGLTRTKKLFAPSSKVTGAALFNGIIVLYTDTGFIKITYETAATS